MRQATTTIPLPTGTSQDSVVRTVEMSLKDVGAKVTSKETSGDEIWIEAETDASLLSWGEEIQIKITDSKVEIRSESEQIIDWGKTRDNVEKIESFLKEEKLGSAGSVGAT